jgi:hypothetical protein
MMRAAARISLLTQNPKTEPRIRRGNVSISGVVEICLNRTPGTRILHPRDKQLGAPANVKAIQRVRQYRRFGNHQTELPSAFGLVRRGTSGAGRNVCRNKNQDASQPD